MTDHDRVITALATVPKTELKIIQLARELVGENGQLDHDKATQRGPEVNLALAEAGAYTRSTAQAITALRDIAARTA